MLNYELFLPFLDPFLNVIVGLVHFSKFGKYPDYFHTKKAHPSSTL